MRQCFGAVFVKHLGHERDQVADNTRVLDQVLDDRIGELGLGEVEIARDLIVFRRHFTVRTRSHGSKAEIERRSFAVTQTTNLSVAYEVILNTPLLL